MLLLLEEEVDSLEFEGVLPGVLGVFGVLIGGGGGGDLTLSMIAYV